jgi:predicted ArsR family transcriptional regulator
LLNLAARKFKNKPTRAYWDELATDLGTKRATVRKWAYELEAMKLLRISRHKGKSGLEGRPGRKNDRNSFDISPFVRCIEAAYETRQAKKAKRMSDLSIEEEAS